jgi:transposase
MGSRSGLVASMSSHGAGSWSARLPGFRAFRRLAKDYEVLPSSEEAWIYLAMIRIMLRRFVQNSS